MTLDIIATIKVQVWMIVCHSMCLTGNWHCLYWTAGIGSSTICNAEGRRSGDRKWIDGSSELSCCNNKKKKITAASCPLKIEHWGADLLGPESGSLNCLRTLIKWGSCWFMCCRWPTKIVTAYMRKSGWNRPIQMKTLCPLTLFPRENMGLQCGCKRPIAQL